MQGQTFPLNRQYLLQGDFPLRACNGAFFSSSLARRLFILRVSTDSAVKREIYGAKLERPISLAVGCCVCAGAIQAALSDLVKT